MKRLAVAAVIVLGLSMAPAASSVAADAPAVTTAAANNLQSDFNNDGYADLAIGGVGVVHVLYGSAGGLTGSDSQQFTQDGRALTTGDFNHDGFADLAIGVAGEDIGAHNEAGAVHVLYGSSTGLGGSDDQYFTQDSAGVGSNVERGDFFGKALVAGDFNNDGYADLVVGAPGESTDSFAVGAVNVLYGGEAGLTGMGSQYFTQNSPGVGSTAERRDHFGTALAAGDFDNDGFDELAIGVPNESSGSTDAAGAVNVLHGRAEGLRGSGSQFFTQNSPRVGSVAELFDEFGSALTAGDFDNDGFAELAIGVPNESSRLSSVGAINVLYGRSTGLTGRSHQYFTQNSPGVWNTAESGDLFGSALTAGDFNNDGFDELAIGARLEDISGALDDAGAVNVLRGGTTGLSGPGSQYFTQNSPGIGPSAVEHYQFGAALAATGP